MHVIKGAKGKKKITKHLKYLQGFSVFPTLSQTSYFHVFVLHSMHLPSTQKFFTSLICRLIEVIPTVMLILLGSP